MKPNDLHLKICTPFQVVLDKENIVRIIIETTQGAWGFFPRRRDCVASLVPGIMTYEVQGEDEQFVALTEGIVVKTGHEVVISTRKAVCGVDLGHLRQAVEAEDKHMREREKTVLTILTKLEHDLVRKIVEFHHG